MPFDEGWFKLSRFLYEPFNAISHFLGALFGVIGTAGLLWETRADPQKWRAFLLYGVTLCALFFSSAFLHGARVSHAKRMILNRLDHIAIFLYIAGTQTPIIATFFFDKWKIPALALIWISALVGSTLKIAGSRIHGGWQAGIYMAMGWASILPAIFLSDIFFAVPLSALGLLGVGGLLYSIGFFIYYWEKPDPYPGVFGHHEIWHIFVLAASFCHYLFMWRVILPYPNLGA